MRTFIIAITLLGCGDGNDASIDASIDATPPALNCMSYCSLIQASCTNTNAQYPAMANCMATCASFSVGTSTVNDTADNTLGCRIHYADGPSIMMAVTQCPHAGPAGDLITAAAPAFCSGGDFCTSFCTLEIMACGSQDMPLPGNPKNADGNPLFQYRNQDNCVNLCHGWDKTHVYSPTSMGDSLACRLNAATSAALSIESAKTYCAYTASSPTGACAGTATP